MSDNITIYDFSRGWTFFIRSNDDYIIPNIFDGPYDCSSFNCSGCNDWLDYYRTNRKFDNFNSQINKHSISLKVVETKVVLSSPIWLNKLDKVALQNFSKLSSMENLLQWSSSHLIRSKMCLETLISVTAHMSIITRKKFVQTSSTNQLKVFTAYWKLIASRNLKVDRPFAYFFAEKVSDQLKLLVSVFRKETSVYLLYFHYTRKV